MPPTESISENRLILYICTYALILVAIDLAYNSVYGQSDEPLRHQPQIEEDQIIICVKDVEHKAYFGQLSCMISNDGLDNPTLKKLGKQAMSLNDTFEMGLID